MKSLYLAALNTSFAKTLAFIAPLLLTFPSDAAHSYISYISRKQNLTLINVVIRNR